jgi:hypothetical protein
MPHSPRRIPESQIIALLREGKSAGDTAAITGAPLSRVTQLQASANLVSPAFVPRREPPVLDRPIIGPPTHWQGEQTAAAPSGRTAAYWAALATPPEPLPLPKPVAVPEPVSAPRMVRMVPDDRRDEHIDFNRLMAQTEAGIHAEGRRAREGRGAA